MLEMVPFFLMIGTNKVIFSVIVCELVLLCVFSFFILKRKKKADSRQNFVSFGHLGDNFEFITDSGLVIPAIDYELRNCLFTAAEQCGFSVDRRLEMIGRSASEMVLQLIGGSSRYVRHTLTLKAPRKIIE